MNENATGFVRKDMVKAAEPYRIGPVGQAAPSPGASMGPASARLISHNGTVALVEVLCSCGKRIQLDCQCEPQETPG